MARLLPDLERYVATLSVELPSERRERLEELAGFVRENVPARLTFICTRNSRRSHMSQLAAAAAAWHHGLDHVETYSGGTEVTAFHPNAIAALRRAGFQIDGEGEGNPRYRVGFAPGAPPIVCYSKVYDDPANPREGFAAVMTCTQANEACPIVRGAAARIAIPWEDPKAADGTPEEAATYDARLRQIASELFYAFSAVRPT